MSKKSITDLNENANMLAKKINNEHKTASVLIQEAVDNYAPHKILINDGEYLISHHDGNIIINHNKKIMSIPERYIRVIHWALGVHNYDYLIGHDESENYRIWEEGQ